MINLSSSTTSQLSQSIQRLDAAADHVQKAAAPGDDFTPKVIPTEASAEERRAAAFESGDSDEGKDLESKLDLARETAGLIQARQEVEANVALVHSHDETLGSLIDIFG